MKNGKKHGPGVVECSGGTKQIGEDKDGKKHGQGTLEWPDGE